MILNKIKNTMGTLVNSVMNKVVSPIERLEYHLEVKENELREVMDNITKLHTEINKLKSSTDTFDRDIDDANRAAKDALRQGNEELAKRILERKITLESSKEKNKKFIEELDTKEQMLKNQSLIFKQSIEDIKAQINVLKMDNNIADVKLKVAEHTTSLNQDSFEIGKQGEFAKDMIDNKNARADAIMELEGEGVYKVLDNKDEVKEMINKTSKEARVNEELEKLKGEI